MAAAAHLLIGEVDRSLSKTDRDVALYVCPLIVAVIAFIGLKATVFEPSSPSPHEIFKSGGPGLLLVDDKAFTIRRDTPQLLTLGDCRSECIWIDVSDWEIPAAPRKPTVNLNIGGITEGVTSEGPVTPGSFYIFSLGKRLAEGEWGEAYLNNYSIRLVVGDERANHANAWVGVFKVLPKSPGTPGTFSGGPVRGGSIETPPDPAFDIADFIQNDRHGNWQ